MKDEKCIEQKYAELTVVIVSEDESYDRTNHRQGSVVNHTLKNNLDQKIQCDQYRL